MGPDKSAFRAGGAAMREMDRITFDPGLMGGKPCIRGLRITVGTLVGLLASGKSKDQILERYPALEAEDIDQALSYAAWRSQEIDLPSSACTFFHCPDPPRQSDRVQAGPGRWGGGRKRGWPDLWPVPGFAAGCVGPNALICSVLQPLDA